jgi:hypothetical protein
MVRFYGSSLKGAPYTGYQTRSFPLAGISQGMSVFPIRALMSSLTGASCAPSIACSLGGFPETGAATQTWPPEATSEHKQKMLD